MNDYSIEVQKGIEWLTKTLDNIDKKNWEHSTAYYSLLKFDNGIANDYIKQGNKEDFWSGIYGGLTERNMHYFYYLYKLGFSNNEFFFDYFNDIIIEDQTVNGRISVNDDNQGGALLSLVEVSPSSKSTSKALEYFINNWKKLNTFEEIQLPLGMIALQKLDYFKYESILKKMRDELLKEQYNHGLLKTEANHYSLNFKKTCFAIIALSRMNNKKVVNKLIKTIKDNQESDGYWSFILNDEKKKGSIELTSLALLALNIAGDGLTVSKEEMKWKLELAKQERNKMKPVFIHTSPLYNDTSHIKEIHDKITEMLNRAENEVLICSLRIDMLYEKIINLSQNDVNFKIITRNGSEARGVRKKIKKNVLELLKISTKGSLRINDVLHSRLVIIDKKEVLITSADLTRDQLIDEFNAGIWTKNKKVLKQAILFFENLWDLSEELKK